MSVPGKASVLFVIGTRPEAIKLAPLIRAFEADATIETRVCITAQHRGLLDQFLVFFRICPEFDLDLMSHNQMLPELTSKAIAACAKVFELVKPDLIFVQGDTTSAFSAALAARLCRISVAHVEAGLRSHCGDSPFPEEINRVLIGQLANIHFAPAEAARENLFREGISEEVHVVGNTIVDALKVALGIIAEDASETYRKKFPTACEGRKIFLVTLHRRENFGRPLAAICQAVRRIAEECPGVEVFYPVHPNPSAKEIPYETLSGIDNIHLLEPLSYDDFVWLLSRAALVLSDSGGVLEEAETLGLPVLVAREVTERGEAIGAGNAWLVGSDPARIFTRAKGILDATEQIDCSERPLRATFGDGQASAHILRHTRKYLFPAFGAVSPKRATPCQTIS